MNVLEITLCVAAFMFVVAALLKDGENIKALIQKHNFVLDQLLNKDKKISALVAQNLKLEKDLQSAFDKIKALQKVVYGKTTRTKK
jgi:hypothetical protein